MTTAPNTTPDMTSDMTQAPAAAAAPLIAQANDLIGRRQFDRALARFEEAAEIDPDDLSIGCRIGEMLTALNRLDEAIAAFGAVLQQDPEAWNAQTGLAEIARRQGAIEDALTLYQGVLARDPGNLPATVGLADLFGRAGEVDAALSLFETAVGTHPRSAVLWSTYGDFQVSVGRCADAVESFKRAEKIDPTAAETQARLAIAYRGLGQLDDALTYFDRAQELWPSNWRIHLGRATVQLARGELADGWRQFDWRNKADPARARLQPQWNGQTLTGQTVFLCGEPTIGDEVMFASCLAEFAASAERCIVECQPALTSLFARSFPEVEFHAAPDSGDPVSPTHRYDWLGELGQIDVYGALGSLPKFLRPTGDSFPAESVPGGAGFLTPELDLLSLWKERLSDLDGKLKIGLWWGGSPPTAKGQALAVGDLLTAFDRPDVEFVMLATDVPMHFPDGLQGPWKDRVSVVEGINPADRDSGAEEAAALIANLDLMVVPPGLVANLAGGLGVPVYVPCQSDDWTHLGTGGMPWFDSMRLFTRHGETPWNQILGPLVEAVHSAAEAAERQAK